VTEGAPWLCPPLDGPATGGTLYNRHLFRALARRGFHVPALELEAGRSALRAGLVRHCWVDSLYLEHVPALRRASPAASLGLVVHYLPSLVALGRPPRRDELSPEERAALDGAHRFLATSPFMSDVLAGLDLSRAHIVTVAPGIDLVGEPSPAEPGADSAKGPLSASMIANLLPGKGVAPLLTALARALDDATPLTLSIVGSAELDVAYGRECRARVTASSRLGARVHFEGALPHDAVLRRLKASDVLVSASRMESSGMALAEARALGVPIVARRGGNVASLVLPEAGGELCDDDAGLARALVDLAGAPGEYRRRRRLAYAARFTRTWDDAASEFIGCGGSLSFTPS
jgi:glycosyltransferase involved in cell wall biosynthesis